MQVDPQYGVNITHCLKPDRGDPLVIEGLVVTIRVDASGAMAYTSRGNPSERRWPYILAQKGFQYEGRGGS